jgi:RimJ/RimL family protein N-acetyltransferase
VAVDIRRLIETDAGAWQRIRMKMLRDHPANFGMTSEEEAAIPLELIERRFRQDKGSKERFILGAFDGGELVGVVGFDRQPGEKRRHIGVMWGIYVDQDHRGRGLGKQLIDRVLDEARSTPGLSHIRVTTNANNEDAKTLYSSCGFTSWGVEPKALNINDELIAEEHYALDLEA